MMALIAALAACACTIVVVLIVGSLFLDKKTDDSHERLAKLLDAKKTSTDESLLVQDAHFTQDWLNAIEERLTRIVTLNHIVEQAGLRLSTTVFFVLCAISGLLGVACSLILKAPGPLIPLTGLFFLFIPLLWLLRQRARRLKAFSVQLPDALEMISRGLRAGHSVGSAMSLVSQQMLAPLGTEFERCCRQQALGLHLADALNEMLRRIPNEDLRFFQTAVRMHQRFGGNLAEILDTIANIVRDRFLVLGQVKALTGEGRLSGIVLLLLPVCVFFALYYMRPDYLRPLFDDPVGKKLLAASVVLQVIGAIAIRKIVNIKI
jgi:tight adherence protein B